MRTKWIDVQVSKELFSKMNKGEINGIECVSEPTTPQTDKSKKDIPYLKVIMTGKKPEKRFENFENVKFPAFCIYGWGTEHVGVINMAYFIDDDDPTYELHDITKQHIGINRRSGWHTLEEMDEACNIQEIVKAKIIIMRGK